MKFALVMALTATLILAAGISSAAFADNPALPEVECNDHVDNDGDTGVDYASDPGCSSQGDETESPNPTTIEHEGDGNVTPVSYAQVYAHLNDPDNVEIEPAPASQWANPDSVPPYSGPSAPGAMPCWDTGYWPPGGVRTTWHVWPFTNRVAERRLWCASRVGTMGRITYRITSVQLYGGTACSHNHPYGFKTVGGRGYYSVTVRTGGNFQCFPVGNYDRWQEWVTDASPRVWFWNSSG